jgi:hypothetical protein
MTKRGSKRCKALWLLSLDRNTINETLTTQEVSISQASDKRAL